MDPLFVLDGGGYVPQPYTDSGWPVPATHGGVVAALLAHAVEAERPDADMQPVRLAIDLLKPVPRARLAVHTHVVRSGKRLKLVDVELRDRDAAVARASGLLLRQETRDAEQAQSLATSGGVPDLDATPAVHWKAGPDPAQPIFHRSVEARRIGEWHRDEPLAAWVRIPFEFLPGVPLTPFERAATVSDFTNSLGALTQRDPARGFINADLALNLLREPAGEWLFVKIVARAHRRGLAISTAHLHDRAGFVGHSAVNCLENPLPERVVQAAAR